MVSVGGRGCADNRWLRGHASDSERTDPMAAEERCGGAAPVHPQHFRHRRMKANTRSALFVAEGYLQQIPTNRQKAAGWITSASPRQWASATKQYFLDSQVSIQLLSTSFLGTSFGIPLHSRRISQLCPGFPSDSERRQDITQLATRACRRQSSSMDSKLLPALKQLEI
jgi:hypothetical protein